MTRVLVLDGGQRKSLTAVRAIAARGHEVYVADDKMVSLAGWSRASRRTIRLPASDGPGFRDALEDATHEHRIDVVLPTDDHSMAALVGREHLGRAALFVPSHDAFMRARDKGRTMELARAAGVRIPRSVEPRTAAEATAAVESFPLPALVKPRESSGARGIAYAQDRETLRAIYERARSIYPWPMLQEWVRPVRGHVHVATLSRDGELMATFTQEVLREWPVGGGVGTLWRSVRDERAIASTEKLVRATRWTGIALTEYLYAEGDDEPILMEMNPRFWNTIALSVACGVDFPGMWVDAALGGQPKGPSSWPVGRIGQWLTPGDLLNFAFNPQRFAQRVGYFPWPGRTHAIWRLDDPLPLLAMLVIIARNALSPRMWRYAFRR